MGDRATRTIATGFRVNPLALASTFIPGRFGRARLVEGPDTSFDNVVAEKLILIVASRPTAARLLTQCASRGWSAVAVGQCSEVVAALQARSPGVVLTEDTLADGNWRDVLRDAATIRPEAVRVVCSGRCTLPLWMDVLAFGGHELLPEPCPDELLERVFNRSSQTGVHT